MDKSRAQLRMPIDPYRVEGYKFGERLRRHVVLWATHLGDDVVVPAGTEVLAIGEGEVVFAKTLPGSEAHRSWGGIIVLRHNYKLKISNYKNDGFYSIYGHLSNLQVKVGDGVVGGQKLGEVAEGLTAENGWWKRAHLHFGIYTGPWHGNVLPGYWRPEQFWRTKKRWWHDPQGFIEEYE